jgi:hypothetical protein
MYKKTVTTKLTIPLENYIINFVMEVPLPPPRNIKVKLSIGEKWTTISRTSPTIFPTVDVSFSNADNLNTIAYFGRFLSYFYLKALA